MNMMKNLKLPTPIFLKTFLRSFALQGSWNFERLQGLGALYVMMPALNYYFQGSARLAACRRHMGYFNTHPFMATSVLGTAIHHEGELAAGLAANDNFQDYRQMVLAPYAAMGDAMFWGGLRPLAAGIALFFALGKSVWAPVVFLLVFNLPHFWYRWNGLYQGCRNGFDSIELVQRKHLPDLAVRLKEGTVILLGGLSAYLMYVELGQKNLSPLWAFGCFPAIYLMGWLARKGVSTLLLVWVMVAVATMTIEIIF